MYKIEYRYGTMHMESSAIPNSLGLDLVYWGRQVNCQSSLVEKIHLD